jgi:hypothetical protein
MWLRVIRGYVKGYKGYKDGLQPETLADGNWLVKENQPVSKIETESDTWLCGILNTWLCQSLCATHQRAICFVLLPSDLRRHVLGVPEAQDR